MQLKTRAISDSGHKYDVELLARKSLLAEEEFHWELVIKGAGSWRMDTLMRSLARRGVFEANHAVDLGQNWYIVNFDEVLKEALVEFVGIADDFAGIATRSSGRTGQ